MNSFLLGERAEKDAMSARKNESENARATAIDQSSLIL